MILNDNLRFAYIHIPKCGGTTIKHSIPQVTKTLLDNGHGELSGHLPLCFLKKERPDIFSKIVAYRSFAHVREPVSRFRSSLFQYNRLNLKLSSTELSDKKLLAIAHDICQELPQQELPFSAQYEHFTPQIHYIETDGGRVVQNLSVTGDFTDLDRFLIENGLNSVNSPQNVSVTPRKGWFKLAARGASPIARKLLKWRTRNHIWEFLVKRGLYRTVTNQRVDFLLKDKDLIDFIQSFYARDFELYAAVVREQKHGSQDR